MYFYDPVDSLDKRRCVKNCPGLNSSGKPEPIECYNADCSQYTIILTEEGVDVSTGFIGPTLYGYESVSIIDRVCLPTLSAFENAFESIKNSFSESL